MRTAQKESASPRKVLVVEDERIIALNICSTLKQFGYESEYVSDGTAAVEKISSDKFDLVLMDIMLGGDIDGIETAKRIKKKVDVPLIYLTAYSDDSTLDRAKITEPAGYLIKPFNSRDLYISVEMALYKSNIQKEIKQMEQRLTEAQKWETIGLVASGISHEINNPLTTILNYSELVSKEANLLGNKKLSDYANKIIQESGRIANIIKNLVSYSETTQNQLSFVNLVLIMNETKSFLHQYFLKEGIQCEIQTADIPLIYCQPQKIKQVFLNLIQDARTRVLNIPEAETRMISVKFTFENKKNDGNLIISVVDTGKEDLSQSMAKREALNISKSIITELGGQITRMENKNGGEWLVLLPLANPVLT